MRFPIVIHKEDDSDFGVTVPDIPGCFSAGISMDNAIDMAQEAIECHLEGMLIDGDPIPAPSDIELHQLNEDYAGGIWALVDVDLSKLAVKSKRINITIPERLLTSVDSYAQKHGSSRSALLAQAVTEYMAEHS